MRQKVESLLPRAILGGDIIVLQMAVVVVVVVVSVNFFKPPDSTHTMGGWAVWYVNYNSTKFFLKDNT